jgi:two-component system chemotaxis response regulator CheB
VLRFRCRVGHAWNPESLLSQQGEQIETALWVALRAIEDRAALSRTLAERAETGARVISAKRFRSEVSELDASIRILRQLLDEHGAEAIQESDG